MLEAARALFAERGDEVQHAEVARAAGVGVGTVYRHFPTRQALVEAAAELPEGARVVHTGCGTSFHAAQTGGLAVQALEAVLDHYTAGGRAHENPNRDSRLRKLDLTPQNRSDLLAFLRALTDEELVHDPAFANPW